MCISFIYIQRDQDVPQFVEDFLGIPLTPHHSDVNFVCLYITHCILPAYQPHPRTRTRTHLPLLTQTRTHTYTHAHTMHRCSHTHYTGTTLAHHK